VNVETYRRKPAEIQAVRFDAETRTDAEALAAWCEGEFRYFVMETGSRGACYISFPTTVGSTVAHHGEWIIRDADGGFRSCTAEDFEEKYEPVP
jgi:hypothetical protein